VSKPPVRTDVDQSTNVAVNLAPQIPFDHLLAVNNLTNSRKIRFAEVSHSRVIDYARSVHDIFGLGRADTKYASQRDLDALIVWNIDSRDYRHISPSACGPVILAVVCAWGFRK